MANPGDQEGEFDSWNVNYPAFYPRGSRRDREFRAARLLVFTSRAWINRIDTLLIRQTGQSRPRWQVLFVLAFGEQPARLTDIAKRAHLQWPSLLKVIEGLESEGLVERESNPADGRSKLDTRKNPSRLGP